MRISYLMAKMLILFCAAAGTALWVFAKAPEGGAKPSVSAQQTPASELAAAHRVVEQTTADMLVLIEEAKKYVNEDEPRFYRELGDLLRKYVDFDAFARGVMGKYVSPARVATLSDAQRTELEQQIKTFTEIFSDSLINTYGKGILVFDGERVEVAPAEAEAEARAKQGKALVKQLIYGETETPFEIYYSLRKNEAGEWKIRNMIVQSTNLGKIYRNQFDNAYKVHDGDINKIIENWVATDDKPQAS